MIDLYFTLRLAWDYFILVIELTLFLIKALNLLLRYAFISILFIHLFSFVMHDLLHSMTFDPRYPLINLLIVILTLTWLVKT